MQHLLTEGASTWTGFGEQLVSDSYVADDLREREDGIIWRVRRGQDRLYVYLLLEFQSTIDRSIAVRILVYLGFTAIPKSG